MPPGPEPLPRGCRTWLALGLCALGLSSCGPVHAETDSPAGIEVRLLDPARSAADFEVKVLWLIGVHGRFGKVHGSVTIDRDHDTVVADARVDVATITMRTQTYEEWVKSDEFFDAAHHPQIRFLSDPFPRDRLRDGGDIAGTMSMRGIDRRTTLHVLASDCPDAIASDCPAEARGSIHRSDFGMKSRRGTLSDKVELGFSVYLAAADAKPDPAR
jgi:polyisoprenoid-binding protein YceI